MTPSPSKPSKTTPAHTHPEPFFPKRVRVRGPGAPQPYWQLVPPTATRVYHLLKASLYKVPPHDLDADLSIFELYLQGDPLLPHENISIIRDGDQLEIRHKQGILSLPKPNILTNHMSSPSPPQTVNHNQVQSNSSLSSSSGAGSNSSGSDSSGNDDSQSDSDDNISSPTGSVDVPTGTPSIPQSSKFRPSPNRILSVPSKRRRNYRNRQRMKRRRLEHANKNILSQSVTEHDEIGPVRSEKEDQQKDTADHPKTTSKGSKSSAKNSANTADVPIQTPSDIPSTPGEHKIAEANPLNTEDMATNHIIHPKPSAMRLRIAGDEKTESGTRSPDIRVQHQGEFEENEHHTKDVSAVNIRKVTLSKKSNGSSSIVPIAKGLDVEKSDSNRLEEWENKEKSLVFQQIENGNHTEDIETEQKNKAAAKDGSRISPVGTNEDVPPSKPVENGEPQENEEFLATQSTTKETLAQAKENALAELTFALASKPNPANAASTQLREGHDMEISEDLDLDDTLVPGDKVKNPHKHKAKRRRYSEKDVPSSTVEAPQIAQTKTKSTHVASLDVNKLPNSEDKNLDQEPETLELNHNESEDVNVEGVENGLSNNPTASDPDQNNAESEEEPTTETKKKHLPAEARYFLEEEQYNESSFLGLDIDIHRDTALSPTRELLEINETPGDTEPSSKDPNEKQDIVLLAAVDLDKFPLDDDGKELHLTKDTCGYNLKEGSKSKITFEDASSMIRSLLETDTNPETIPKAAKSTPNESSRVPPVQDERQEKSPVPPSPPTAWKVSGRIVNFVETDDQKRKSEKTSQQPLNEHVLSTENSYLDSTHPEAGGAEEPNSTPKVIGEEDVLAQKYPDNNTSPKPTPFSSLSSDNRTPSPIREDDRHVEQMKVSNPEFNQQDQFVKDLQDPQESTLKTGVKVNVELGNDVTSPKDDAAPSPSLEDSVDRSVPDVRFASTDFRTCLYTTLVETSNVLNQLYRSR